MNVELHRPKTWCLPDIDESAVVSFAKQLGVPVPVGSVYLVRGLTTIEEANEFTATGLDQLHDPYLLPDMEPAVERIVEAIRNEDKILVHGDGDADGISSAALVSFALESLGADGFCHVPCRLSDGFGLTADTIDRAKELGANLIITTDCGTESFEAAERAYDDIHLVITDHHEPCADGSIPECTAVVNPKRLDSTYPFPHLSGTGVAFKLMHAVYERLGVDPAGYLPHLLEYVGIGTVADCVSMTGENRALVAMACEQLSQTRKAGFIELMKAASIRGNVDTTAIGYYLAPWINSSARFGKPELALQLLLESRSARAKELAGQLKLLNDERKIAQENLLSLVITTLPDDPYEHPILLAAGENWHPGLIGIVAGKMASEFGKPSFVCSIDENGNARGSCRAGSPYINVLGLLDTCSDILTRYGGHAAAAGFELPAEHLCELEDRLNTAAITAMLGSEPNNNLEIDAYLPFRDIMGVTYEAVQNLAPFGTDNPEPLFFTPDLVVAQSYTFGRDNKHLGMAITDNKRQECIRAIGWNCGNLIEQFPHGVMVDLAHKMALDGRKSESINLIIEDIRHSR